MEPIERELERLAPALDSLEVSEPSEQLVRRTLQMAAAELRLGAETALQQPGHAYIPAGFKRELARLLGASALSLPLYLLWNLGILTLGREILLMWLPTSYTWALTGVYLFGAVGWLALVLGTLPVLAHRRALLRHNEAVT
jgi:hypothetical protein